MLVYYWFYYSLIDSSWNLICRHRRTFLSACLCISTHTYICIYVFNLARKTVFMSERERETEQYIPRFL